VDVGGILMRGQALAQNFEFQCGKISSTKRRADVLKMGAVIGVLTKPSGALREQHWHLAPKREGWACLSDAYLFPIPLLVSPPSALRIPLCIPVTHSSPCRPKVLLVHGRGLGNSWLVRGREGAYEACPVRGANRGGATRRRLPTRLWPGRAPVE